MLVPRPSTVQFKEDFQSLLRGEAPVMFFLRPVTLLEGFRDGHDLLHGITDLSTRTASTEGRDGLLRTTEDVLRQRIIEIIRK